MTGETTNPINQDPQPDEPEKPETDNHFDKPVTPKIYAASLSDYNDGCLHGEWITANQPPEDIYMAVEAMLDASPSPDAEEFAIHDYEGFEAFRLHEYDNLDTVSRIANGIVEHGRPFSHWVGFVGTSDIAALEGFEDHYRGQWPTLADYAQELAADQGIEAGKLGPDWIAPYVRIDFDGLGRDLAQDLETAEDPNAVHIFEPYQ